MLLDPRSVSVASPECIRTLPFADEYIRKTDPSILKDSTRSLGTAISTVDASHLNSSTGLKVQVEHDPCRPDSPLQHAELHVQHPPTQESHVRSSPPAYKSSGQPLEVNIGVNIASNSHSDRLADLRHEPLEDYDGIDAGLVDRYGFYDQSEERRFPALESNIPSINTRTSLRRTGTLTRRGLQRASVNLGLIASKDYTATTKADPFDSAQEVKRARKWTEMARRRPDDTEFHFKLSAKLRTRVYKGIPDCWRASAWSSLLSHHSSPVSDHHLRQQYYLLIASSSEYDAQIELDVPRTISGHVLFRHRHVGGQRLLSRVLHAISVQYPSAGYVQGMASVAAMCLCYYPEDQAFIVLCRLWSERNMAQLYDAGFSTLMSALKNLEMVMSRSEVGRHLLKIGCSALAWATRWYLTIFHISVPFRTQLRIWDIFMLHGETTEVSRFAVLEATTMALLQGIETLLLESDFENAMSILTRPLPVQDDDRLMQAIRKKLRP